MREAPAGIVGAFAAHRPFLASGLLFAGLATILTMALRRTDADEMIFAFALNAFVIVAAPAVLAALRPQRASFQVLHFVGVGAIVAALLYWNAHGAVFSVAAPHSGSVLAGGALFVFIIVMAPISENAARLSIIAPLSAFVGAVGATGFLAIAGWLDDMSGAMAAGGALALGVGVGFGVGANFAEIFARGGDQKNAAAAAGHGAIATVAFSLMSFAAAFAVASYKVNFGAIEPGLVWAAITIASAAMIAALVFGVAALALANVNERAAYDENRRRAWFAVRWRPIRLALPASTATAAVAITGIFVVIALFETNIADPASLAVFVALVWIASGAAFVSVRTSAMIALSLGASAVLAEYALAIVGVSAPGLPAKLTALALAAAALGHLTVCWRDAQERWRNTRDVVENALSGGIRRYVYIVGPGAGALYAARLGFGWTEGDATIVYFLAVSMFALALSPFAMTAMSARLRL